jgi:UDP-N-acetylmuramoylalanine--D-glutamate ligase
VQPSRTPALQTAAYGAWRQLSGDIDLNALARRRSRDADASRTPSRTLVGEMAAAAGRKSQSVAISVRRHETLLDDEDGVGNVELSSFQLETTDQLNAKWRPA